ncbi:MAG TPA: ATP synthase F1 subunit delta [Chitinophagaceae bacterium]|nr:ATP synthase F1 subunit delta [Chitinophagaceae bacterium]HAN40272.1 ATP synthase F1 subunit delta [Chitinophagaceae bacterium]
MTNPRLAARYAKSLIDLSQEQGKLEEVYADMRYMQALAKASKELVALLKSPIVKGDKKLAVIESLTNGKVGALTSGFNRLLVNKGRENDLVAIVDAFIDQYNTLKDIHRVKFTTAVAVSDTLKQSIVNTVKAQTGFTHIELEAKVDANIIGGFVLEFDNNLVDASVARDLRDLKAQFSKNWYVPNMR